MGVNVNWPNPLTELSKAYRWTQSITSRNISRRDVSPAHRMYIELMELSYYNP
jgi:hypothetical protein